LVVAVGISLLQNQTFDYSMLRKRTEVLSEGPVLTRTAQEPVAAAKAEAVR